MHLKRTRLRVPQLITILHILKLNVKEGLVNVEKRLYRHIHREILLNFCLTHIQLRLFDFVNHERYVIWLDEAIFSQGTTLV